MNFFSKEKFKNVTNNNILYTNNLVVLIEFSKQFDICGAGGPKLHFFTFLPTVIWYDKSQKHNVCM